MVLGHHFWFFSFILFCVYVHVLYVSKVSTLSYSSHNLCRKLPDPDPRESSLSLILVLEVMVLVMILRWYSYIILFFFLFFFKMRNNYLIILFEWCFENGLYESFLLVPLSFQIFLLSQITSNTFVNTPMRNFLFWVFRLSGMLGRRLVLSQQEPEL